MVHLFLPFSCTRIDPLPIPRTDPCNCTSTTPKLRSTTNHSITGARTRSRIWILNWEDRITEWFIRMISSIYSSPELPFPKDSTNKTRQPVTSM